MSYHIVGTEYSLKYNKVNSTIDVFSDLRKKVEKSTNVKLTKKEFENECKYYFEQTVLRMRGLN
jgi:hypothetical protein